MGKYVFFYYKYAIIKKLSINSRQNKDLVSLAERKRKDLNYEYIWLFKNKAEKKQW